MRRLIAVALNLTFLPLGYYYLKRHSRFVAFTGVSLLFPFFALFYLRFALSLVGAFWSTLILALFAIGFYGYICVDTWRLAAKETGVKPAKFYSIPHSLWFLPLFVLVVVLVSVFKDTIKPGILDARSVSTAGMEPTINATEYIYLKRPDDGRIERGEIVSHNSQGRLLLHRVIGIPGDRIAFSQVNHGLRGHNVSVLTYLINDIPVRHEFTGETARGLDLDIRNPDASFAIVESYPGIPSYTILETADHSPVPSTLVLGADEYFVLGDNRDDSADSRFLGQVLGKEIVGKYVGSYLSINRSIYAKGLLEHPCAFKSSSPVCLPFWVKTYIFGKIRWNKLLQRGAASHN